MAEHEVMWIGRRPAALATVPTAAATEEFAAAVTAACADSGCDVQDYVAAAGAYGSWLVRFTRAGARERLVWNGKDGRLLLERATSGAEWSPLTERSVVDRDAAGFVAAINGLLSSSPA